MHHPGKKKKIPICFSCIESYLPDLCHLENEGYDPERNEVPHLSHRNGVFGQMDGQTDSTIICPMNVYKTI